MLAADAAGADLVEAILDGEQPRTMELQPLVRGLAVVWEEQRRNCGVR